ncbi:hypothetical protein NC652_035723 [Populus alba x Populus x berolinensis]|nr:hypothetical protein NC652_035723 [Populus alba x Populus x berolinensis]
MLKVRHIFASKRPNQKAPHPHHIRYFNLQDHPIKSRHLIPNLGSNTTSSTHYSRSLVPCSSIPARSLLQEIVEKLKQITKEYGVQIWALESDLDSGRQGVASVPGMAPSRVAGGLAQSSSSSGIFFQGDGQFQGSSFGNLNKFYYWNWATHFGSSFWGHDNVVLNSVANSEGPSCGGDICDCQRLPMSPFSSNNISIIQALKLLMGPLWCSSSQAITCRTEMSRQCAAESAAAHIVRTSSATILCLHHKFGGISLPLGPLRSGGPSFKTLIIYRNVANNCYAKTGLHAVARPNSTAIQNMFHQPETDGNNSKFVQSMPPLQRAQLQQQTADAVEAANDTGMAMQPASSLKRPFDGGEHYVQYWRKFVAEYYSHVQRKGGVLSSDNGTMLGHPCARRCGSVRFAALSLEEVLRQLSKVTSLRLNDNQVWKWCQLMKLLFLDIPRELRLSSGLMMLEYAKAVQESVYEATSCCSYCLGNFVYAVMTNFFHGGGCTYRLRRKCQSTIAESGSDGGLTASRQLAKSLELQSAETILSLRLSNSMKDLIDFCREQKIIPGMRLAAKLQITENAGNGAVSKCYKVCQLIKNTLNKLMAFTSWNITAIVPSSKTFKEPLNFIPGSMQNTPASGFSSPNIYLPNSPADAAALIEALISLLQQSHSTSRSGQGNQALQCTHT